MAHHRSSVLLVAVLLGAASYAQTCVHVSVQGEGPAKGEVVHCADGGLPGIVDGFGQFCPRSPCDTLVFGNDELQPQRLAWSDVLRRGEVILVKRPNTLAPLEIMPWPAKKDRQALAAVSSVDPRTIDGTSEASLRHALAGLPGVRMDERGMGGSSRLSIRGSLLRSPYGTRGVKVYWGPFALTLADGSTPLELLDPLLVGSLDVVRSVGGPSQGSGPSGVLLADAPWRTTAGTSGTLAAVAGPYGYYKLSAQLQARDSTGSAISIGATRMDNSGYRTQEASHRDQLFLAAQWRHSGGVTRAYLTAQRASWQLPGSIDSLTAYEHPRSPRPYSQLINAHIEKQQVLAGVAHEQHLMGPVIMHVAVQAQAIDKLNPYGTTKASSGYKDEDIQGGGTRVWLSGAHSGHPVAFAWDLGLEGLLEKDHLFEQDYANGVIGGTRTNATTRVGNLNGFLATRTRFGEHTTLFADIGTERTSFDLDDGLLHNDISTTRNATLRPLIGIEERLGRGFTAHARYTSTTSRPTIWELLGSTGTFNPTLVAEEVSEVEAGFDLADPDGTWAAGVVGYLRTTDGLIQQRTLDDGDITVFQNTGDARQDGIELTGRKACVLGGDHRLELLVNGAWQYHRLTLPENAGTIDVPGVPRWSGGGLLQWRAPWRSSLSVEGLLASNVRAGTTTTAEVPGYSIWSVRLEQELRRGEGTWSVFVRLDNVLDTRYTAFVQLDDPGGRYYNPAPGRSFFAGLAFRFGDVRQ